MRNKKKIIAYPIELRPVIENGKQLEEKEILQN